jgi:hypothetical protein
MTKEADKYFAAMGFAPQLTPHEILRLGAFDGHYFGAALPAEFPHKWVDRAPFCWTPEPGVNAFHVHSGQSREVWEQKGWMHADDPLGWFQWYCRYYMGRRHEDDVRQIKRWKNFARHQGMLRYRVRNKPEDEHLFAEPVTRQSLIHWAYDPFFDRRAVASDITVFGKAQRLLAVLDAHK